jgi:molecular chaperone GrpE
MPETTDSGDASPETDEAFAKTIDLDEEFGGDGDELSEDTVAVEEDEELSELELAIRERDEAKALWMRAQADYQNLRRRTQADIDSAVTRAKTEVLGEAVTVLDYLDMALAAPVTTDEAKNLKIGVEMTRTQLQGLFDRLAVKPIVAEGTFDPAFHQAISTVESTEHEPGTIVEVVRGGWQMGESVLRFAQVRVAAEPEAEGDGEAAADAETVEIPSESSSESPSAAPSESPSEDPES